jgi:hypothetical protein
VRGERAMKKIYKENLKDKKEEKVVKAEDNKEIVVQYKHYPNVVGKRSVYTGLPIWVGKTEAEANGIKAEAKCWVGEPYSYDQARVVVTGRILKQMGLPTKLAEQVRD